MSFTSYAQNLEDVMLWRALRHISSGYYLDIGAWSPDLDSVTRGFYELGWSGVNVEPNVELHTELVLRRARDTNLCMAVSDISGQLPMHFMRNSGLSTLDGSIADQNVAAGQEVDRVLPVSVTTLRQLWQDHVGPDRDVHFLKIDVEGLEGRVLRGGDWNRFRPWIVVIEATAPMSQQASHEQWEQVLFSAMYQYVYTDGINRFYLANEHQALKAMFTHAPNYFDDYVLGRSQQLISQIEKLTTWLDASQNRAKQVESDRHELADAVTALQKQLADLSHLFANAREELTQAEKDRGALQEQLSDLSRRTAAAEVAVDQAQSETHNAIYKLAEMARRATKAEAHIQTMLRSTSWRLTFPIRAVKTIWQSYRTAAELRSSPPGPSDYPTDGIEALISEQHLTRTGRRNYLAVLRATTSTGENS